MSLDLSRPVTTQDGQEARIYGTDGSGPYPIHGAYLGETRWKVAAWTSDGRYLTDRGHPKDLVNSRGECETSVELNVVADSKGNAIFGFQNWYPECVTLTGRLKITATHEKVDGKWVLTDWEVEKCKL